MSGLRVVVAEDTVLLREGLVRLLTENGHRVVAAVGDGPALIEAVGEHRPDVSIVDVRMPPTNTTEGLEAAQRLRRERPGIGILVLSQYVETRYAIDLVREDARGLGYLLKDRVADFAAFAASFGAFAARVERTDAFAPALERALASGGPALLHLLVDPEAITPHTTLTAVREGKGGRERTETV